MADSTTILGRLQSVFLRGAAAALMVASSASLAAPGDTELVTVNVFTGTAAGGGWSVVELSQTGRYVAFSSYATTLMAGDSNRFSDVFVRDRATGTTERISIAAGGLEANGDSSLASLSSDGRYVLFASDASNLTPQDLNGKRDLFLRDRATGTTTRVPVGPAGVGEANGGVSNDGRFVAYRGGAGGIYRRDMQSKTSRFIASTVSANSTYFPRISGDGRFVVYEEESLGQIVIYDFLTGSTELYQGTHLDYGISPNGQWIAYVNGYSQLLLRNRVTDQVQVVYSDPNYSRPAAPSVSDDGRYVAFSIGIFSGSDPTVFLRDMQTDTLDYLVPNTWVWTLSGDGHFLGFWSRDRLVVDDLNSLDDLYVQETRAAWPIPPQYELYLRPLSIDYGYVAIGTSLKKGFTLRNAGNVPLPITTLELLGADRSQYVLRSFCGSPLAVGSHCWISVAFRPTSTGYKQANLHVVAGGIDRHRALRGIGVR